jgi:hypothetical protein
MNKLKKLKLTGVRSTWEFRRERELRMAIPSSKNIIKENGKY